MRDDRMRLLGVNNLRSVLFSLVIDVTDAGIDNDNL